MTKKEKVEASAAEYLIRNLGDALGTGKVCRKSKTIYVVPIVARLENRKRRVVGELVVDLRTLKVVNSPTRNEVTERLG